MIYTGCYREFSSEVLNLPNFYLRTVSISGDRGKDANWKGDCYPKLAPKMSFWKIWHDNIGKVPEVCNNQYYIEQYYSQVLAKLDPREVYEELGTTTVLLCYEPCQEFCHRHVVAAWLELTLGITVNEIKIQHGYGYEDVWRTEIIEKPHYIKQYLKECMERVKTC